MEVNRTILSSILLPLLLSLPLAVAGDIYYYQTTTGGSLISDRPLSAPGMVLRKTSSINSLYKRDKPSHQSGNGNGNGRNKSKISAPVTKTTYDRLIRKVAGQYSVEPSLVKAIMHAESYFNPKAVSSSGAQGLMQLMPQTARQYGVANAFNPGQNLEGALRYIQFLKSLFPKRPQLVIAAYNAGENAVYKHQGIPPYNETQQYVKKVVALKRFYDLLQSP